MRSGKSPPHSTSCDPNIIVINFKNILCVKEKIKYWLVSNF